MPLHCRDLSPTFGDCFSSESWMWGPRRARGPWLGPVIPRPLPEGSPRQERPSLIGRPPPTHPTSPPCLSRRNCSLLESSVLFFFIQQLLMEPKLFPCRGLCTGWSLGLGLLAPSSAPDSVAVSAEAAPPPTPLIAPSFSPYPSFFKMSFVYLFAVLLQFFPPCSTRDGGTFGVRIESPPGPRCPGNAWHTVGAQAALPHGAPPLCQGRGSEQAGP